MEIIGFFEKQARHPAYGRRALVIAGLLFLLVGLVLAVDRQDWYPTSSWWTSGAFVLCIAGTRWAKTEFLRWTFVVLSVLLSMLTVFAIYYWVL